MTTNETPKTIRLSDELWRGISNVRFGRRFQSEADAIRAIVEAGIAKLAIKYPTKNER
jgi:hypothetical protein